MRILGGRSGLVRKLSAGKPLQLVAKIYEYRDNLIGHGAMRSRQHCTYDRGQHFTDTTW